MVVHLLKMIFTHHFTVRDRLREGICLPNCLWMQLIAKSQLILAREPEICQFKTGQGVDHWYKERLGLRWAKERLTTSILMNEWL